MGLKLEQAQRIVAAALAYARAKSLKPMAFVVIDERGALRAAAAEDGTSLARWKVAYGKAQGALSMGVSSRKLHDMAVERPHFIASLASVFKEGIVPVGRSLALARAEDALLNVLPKASKAQQRTILGAAQSHLALASKAGDAAAAYDLMRLHSALSKLVDTRDWLMPAERSRRGRR